MPVHFLKKELYFAGETINMISRPLQLESLPIFLWGVFMGVECEKVVKGCAGVGISMVRQHLQTESGKQFQQVGIIAAELFKMVGWNVGGKIRLVSLISHLRINY